MPLHPQLQTSPGDVATSALCQKRTFCAAIKGSFRGASFVAELQQSRKKRCCCPKQQQMKIIA